MQLPLRLQPPSPMNTLRRSASPERLLTSLRKSALRRPGMCLSKRRWLRATTSLRCSVTLLTSYATRETPKTIRSSVIVSTGLYAGSSMITPVESSVTAPGSCSGNLKRRSRTLTTATHAAQGFQTCGAGTNSTRTRLDKSRTGSNSARNSPHFRFRSGSLRKLARPNRNLRSSPPRWATQDPACPSPTIPKARYRPWQRRRPCSPNSTHQSQSPWRMTRRQPRQRLRALSVS